MFSAIRSFFGSDLGKKVLGWMRNIGIALLGLFGVEFTVAKVKSTKAEKIKNKAVEEHDAARKVLEKYLAELCTTKCSVYKGFGELADLIEKIQQRPDFIVQIKDIDLPEFKPKEYKKLAFEAEAFAGGTLGAVVGGSACMAVMGTGAVAGGVLGSGFILCAMGLNMVNRAANKKKQAVQIREEVKRIISFYEKLGKSSVLYRDDLEKVLTQFNKSKGKMLKLLERKTNWQDFSKAERRHVENAVMLAQLLCYMCSVNLVLVPTEADPIEQLNEEALKQIRKDADAAMSQVKLRLLFN